MDLTTILAIVGAAATLIGIIYNIGNWAGNISKQVEMVPKQMEMLIGIVGDMKTAFIRFEQNRTEDIKDMAAMKERLTRLEDRNSYEDKTEADAKEEK